jgi:hypothetical protein
MGVRQGSWLPQAAQFFGQLRKMMPISCDAMAVDLQTITV